MRLVHHVSPSMASRIYKVAMVHVALPSRKQAKLHTCQNHTHGMHLRNCSSNIANIGTALTAWTCRLTRITRIYRRSLPGLWKRRLVSDRSDLPCSQRVHKNDSTSTFGEHENDSIQACNCVWTGAKRSKLDGRDLILIISVNNTNSVASGAQFLSSEVNLKPRYLTSFQTTHLRRTEIWSNGYLQGTFPFGLVISQVRIKHSKSTNLVEVACCVRSCTSPLIIIVPVLVLERDTNHLNAWVAPCSDEVLFVLRKRVMIWDYPQVLIIKAYFMSTMVVISFAVDIVKVIDFFLRDSERSELWHTKWRTKYFISPV